MRKIHGDGRPERGTTVSIFVQTGNVHHKALFSVDTFYPAQIVTRDAYMRSFYGSLLRNSGTHTPHER